MANPKSLLRRLKQLSDLSRKSDFRRRTVDANPNGTVEHRMQVRELDNNLENEIMNVARPEDSKKSKEWMDKCTDIMEKYGGPSCWEQWYNSKFIDFAPKEADIRMDPLSYTDHPSAIIRNFARELVQGE